MPNKRTIDLLVESFDLSVRRKYEINNANGDVVTTLYFPPITRADRKKAQARANTTDGLEISTQMLCQIAEKEDGSKHFAPADAINLQREIPEKILNDIELFPDSAQSAKKFGFSGIITSAEYGATLGEVQIINISFITSGAITSAI